MSGDDALSRAGRAFRAHGSFEQRDEDAFESVTTPFDAAVSVAAGDDGRVRLAVSVTVPMLDAVTADDVAPVVEDGWYETFELRVTDVGGVATADEVETSVTRQGDEATVEMVYEDVDARRGADDANALVSFVEGTYVQGVIPGYEYTDPVASLVSRAQDAAGSGPA